MSDDTLPNIPTAAEIEHFDLVYDVPSPVEVIGDVRVSEPQLSGLPPEMRDRITAKLANVTPGNRDIFEREFILKELEDNSLMVRVKAGCGAGATEYQRELFCLENEVRIAEVERDRLTAELAEVTGYESVTDERTGAIEPKPVLRFVGEARTKRDAALREAVRHISLLKDVEGPKRLAEAKERTIAKAQATRDALADEAEAKRRGEAMIREQRINARAETHARMRSSNLG